MVAVYSSFDSSISYNVFSADYLVEYGGVSLGSPSLSFLDPFGILVGRSGLSCVDNLLIESGNNFIF